MPERNPRAARNAAASDAPVCGAPACYRSARHPNVPRGPHGRSDAAATRFRFECRFRCDEESAGIGGVRQRRRLVERRLAPVRAVAVGVDRDHRRLRRDRDPAPLRPADRQRRVDGPLARSRRRDHGRMPGAGPRRRADDQSPLQRLFRPPHPAPRRRPPLSRRHGGDPVRRVRHRGRHHRDERHRRAHERAIRSRRLHHARDARLRRAARGARGHARSRCR